MSAISEAKRVCRQVTDAERSLGAAVKRRLATFFRDNRFTMDTAQGLSQWIGCSAEEISVAADALVDDGILTRRGEQQFAVYSIARNT